MRTQQDNQVKRTKNYYYFVLQLNENYQAYEGDIYENNGIRFTVFETIPFNNFSSSSSSISSESSSSSSLDSSSSSSLDSSSSSSSSSIDSSSSSSSSTSQSSESSSSSSLDSSSTSLYPPTTTTTTTPYYQQIILTCVASANPSNSGTLTLIKGDGSTSLNFTSYTKKVSSFSTIYSFAYQNWNQDPRPIVRWNNRLVDDGWHADYQGNIYWDGLMAPEDSIATAYNFAYFSQQELLSFLRFGLQMMNGLPPASSAYPYLETAPYQWDAGILLYAAILALKRLIFGLNFQEKRVIFGRPEDAQNAQAKFQELYSSYTETFTEFGKNVKTRKLPGIAMFVTPEYTLPGGRSRWFRYLYKNGS